MIASRHKKAVTLTELIIAILLLSAVIVTSVTVELALRRMQVKPINEAKLLDEIIPVMERINKDFERQIGSVFNSSLSIESGGQRLVIRVDSDNSSTTSSGDEWHAYNWPGGTSAPIEYYQNNTTLTEIIAQNITDFFVASSYDNTTINVTIRTRKDPSQPENILTNPAVNLTETIFSRMTSAM